MEQNNFLCQYGRNEYKIDLNYAFIVKGRHVVFIKSKCITLVAQNTAIIRWFEIKNPTNTSQREIKNYFIPLNARLYNFLWQKNLAVNHLPLEALPAVQTWPANWKRDRKAVVTWQFAVCGLQFPTKNVMLKVPNDFQTPVSFSQDNVTPFAGARLSSLGDYFWISVNSLATAGLIDTLETRSRSI